MLNVRINEELEKKLKQYSEQNQMPKSAVVKEALAQYFSQKDASQSPFAIGKDLFGLAGSGNPNASTSYKKKVKEKLNEKHSH